jgi:thiaminase/transcriptional activator TenA
MNALAGIAPADGLFMRLRGAAGGDWDAYTGHPFVTRLAAGDLPEPCFRHYLGQDYLFLIHFARAFALAAYKSDNLEDIRQASGGMKTILDMEIGLHIEFCAGWGLDEAAMAALPEAAETMAYTRYVLERGLSGDLLDLHVALSPCILGYAEIGRRIAREHGATIAGNPYRAWIEMYAGEEYGEAARAAAEQLDRILLHRTGQDAGAIESTARWGSLVTTFREACRLEASFWQMGLNAA